jgi:hypothetical protein
MSFAKPVPVTRELRRAALLHYINGFADNTAQFCKDKNFLLPAFEQTTLGRISSLCRDHLTATNG